SFVPFSSQCYSDRLDLHSFPTRRSSDLVVQDHFHIACFGVDEGCDEVARAVVQRLVELAVQLLVLAQLQSGQPLGAQRVDAIDPEARAYGEAAASLEIVGQVQPQAQVVGAGLATMGADQQGIALALVHYLVIDLTEVVGAVDGTHVLGQVVGVQRLTQLLAHHAAYYLVGDLAAVDHPDVMDDRLAVGAGTGQVAPGAVIPG